MGTVLDKNSSAVRKRIEKHTFDDEGGEEYEPSAFNGFPDYFRRKKIKLQNRDADIRASSGKPQLFKGIVAHVTGYTQPPIHILHKEIVEHGGGFLQYLDSKTMATHIIASSLPPKKSIDFNRYRIVKPGWIMDSIKAGRLLPWSDYRVLDEGPRQKVLKLGPDHALTQTASSARQGYREQTDNSYYNHQYRSSIANDLPTQALDHVEQLPLNDHVSHATRIEQPLIAETPADDSVQPESNPPEKVPEMSPNQLIPDDSGKMSREDASIPPELAERLQNMTSEEHNAWLLSDARLRKSSTANPDFIKQYYAESRLHHLSTWKAELKSRMQKLAAQKGLAERKGKRKPGSRRYVMHVDFDSFFCAVSLKKFPQLVDQPTVVAHSNGPGSEIASCNYPARAFGVKNGMWMKRALDLCADLKVVPYDFPAYEEASRLFYESILELGGVVQSVSIDEALVDITSTVLTSTGSQGFGVDEGSVWREQEKASDLASTLRSKIKDCTGCEVSVGIGGNILQAKVALRKAKPAGQWHLRPEDVLSTIGELDVSSLPGVAYSISGKLEEVGVKFVKDIREISMERLSTLLGPKTGEKLKEYARGIDNVEVGDQPPRKSVSAEINWGIRFLNQPEAEEFVLNLCKELERRLINEDVKGRQLTMKIMRRALDAPLDPAKHLGHGKCDTFNRSISFGVATRDAEAIAKEAVSILRAFKFSPGDLRGLGVQMTKLEKCRPHATGLDGSQKKLVFGLGRGTLPSAQEVESLNAADGEKAYRAQAREEAEGIDDDPMTPRKPKVHPAMALTKAAEKDPQSRTPLNVSGTQFMLPSNPDRAILEELPSDIRRRLTGQRQKPLNVTKLGSPTSRSRSGSPMPPEALPSQVDAEVFNALPEDMKTEILTAYGRHPATPTKDRTANAKKQVTPSKRGVSRNLFARGERQKDAQAGLMQTNFKAGKPGDGFQDATFAEELDPTFLAELPEDVRREVIADHRRQRLAARSGLDAPARASRFTEADELALPRGQQTIQFPAPPPSISFAAGISSTRETKDMLDAWHDETSRDGPHQDDVQVFEKYLVRLVTDGRDMEKAVRLVKWLEVLVSQDGSEARGRRSWDKALAGVKATVQQAVRQLGRGPVRF